MSSLHNHVFSLDHALLLDTLAQDKRLLIIQDLDGVCMGLVRDPLSRTLACRYVEAAKQLRGQFFVLTNGEHIGQRGVNPIIERSFADASVVQQQGLYLPGLAGGGVQFQDPQGQVSHPGVTAAELNFLRAIPQQARDFLQQRLAQPPYELPATQRTQLIEATVLDNLVSPTINLNSLYARLADQPTAYRQLQQEVDQWLQTQLQQAQTQGLDNAFFIHYAPNLGRDAQGERIKFSQGEDAGTTDFQLMLRGALKEVGVLVLLNHYYYSQTGEYPLGAGFNVRQAPHDPEALVALARSHLDPKFMPRLVGVGDTVTSNTLGPEDGEAVVRGGSDRGFLTLTQRLGQAFQTDNAVLYIDSSQGEVRRPGIRREHLLSDSPWPGFQGITDAKDDLHLNFIFPEGHTQYVEFFCALAARRSS